MADPIIADPENTQPNVALPPGLITEDTEATSPSGVPRMFLPPLPPGAIPPAQYHFPTYREFLAQMLNDIENRRFGTDQHKQDNLDKAWYFRPQIASSNKTIKALVVAQIQSILEQSHESSEADSNPINVIKTYIESLKKYPEGLNIWMSICVSLHWNLRSSPINTARHIYSYKASPYFKRFLGPNAIPRLKQFVSELTTYFNSEAFFAVNFEEVQNVTDPNYTGIEQFIDYQLDTLNVNEDTKINEKPVERAEHDPDSIRFNVYKKYYPPNDSSNTTAPTPPETVTGYDSEHNSHADDNGDTTHNHADNNESTVRNLVEQEQVTDQETCSCIIL